MLLLYKSSRTLTSSVILRQQHTLDERVFRKGSNPPAYTDNFHRMRLRASRSIFKLLALHFKPGEPWVSLRKCSQPSLSRGSNNIEHEAKEVKLSFQEFSAQRDQSPSVWCESRRERLTGVSARAPGVTDAQQQGSALPVRCSLFYRRR